MSSLIFPSWTQKPWFRRGCAIFLLIIVFFAGVWFNKSARYRSSYSYDYEAPQISSSSFASTGSAFNEGSEKLMADTVAQTTAVDSDSGTETQKVIKTGSLSITVKTTVDTVSAITGIATAYNGFVQSSNQWVQSDETTAATITVRVDSASFEQALSDLKALATVVRSELVSGQDVTEEYVDLQSNLKNLQAEEAQYLIILNKATTVEDLLSVSDYLARVRGDIEQIQGRLKYLTNRTDYATITVSVYEEASVVIPTNDWQPVVVAKQAFNRLVETGQNGVNGLIWIVTFGFPFFVLVWAVRGAWRFFHRRHYK